MRPQALGIQHSGLFDHVAVLDPGSPDDEALVGRVALLQLAPGNRVGVFSIPGLDGLAQGVDQFGIGDAVPGRPKPGSGQNCSVHVIAPYHPVRIDDSPRHSPRSWREGEHLRSPEDRLRMGG